MKERKEINRFPLTSRFCCHGLKDCLNRSLLTKHTYETRKRRQLRQTNLMKPAINMKNQHLTWWFVHPARTTIPRLPTVAMFKCLMNQIFDIYL